jgi:hypothetical protein
MEKQAERITPSILMPYHTAKTSIGNFMHGGRFENTFQQTMKLSITLDTFSTRIMKRSVRRQPLRKIFAALQQVESRRLPSRSCGCSSSS